jgi:hypothetical protein
VDQRTRQSEFPSRVQMAAVRRSAAKAGDPG